MAYRVQGIPYTPFSDIPTPEQITDVSKAPAGGLRPDANFLVKALGLAPNVPLSDEAWRAMNSGEVAAAQSEAGRAGTWNLVKILAALATVFAPQAALLAGGANQEADNAEARAHGVVRNAVERAQQEKVRSFLGQKEGLLPTPSGSVTGYMSEGEYRGRMAGAAEDRAQAALDKATAQAQLKLEAEVVPIFRKLAVQNPKAALQYYLLQKQSSINPYGALLGSSAIQQMEQILQQSGANLGGNGGGKAKAGGGSKAAGAAPTTPEEALQMGWKYREDKQSGKKGYVSPDGKLVLPVK